MKENKYDDIHFFEKYAEMERSKKGLEAAGEWHELKKLLPGFRGKRVLDLGCGYGWHCIYAAEHGASRVVGADISERMLREARARTRSGNVEYICAAMEDIDFPPDSFDIVISSLAFHYVADFSVICGKVHTILDDRGDFVFSVEHPVFTARGDQDWHYDGNGNKQHWPVDGYFDEGERNAVFLEEEVLKYHRTVSSYIQSLLRCGFEIRDMAEPRPGKEMLDMHPEMTEELRRPMMLIIAAKKK